tara:strand:+ start:1125 stop:2345 length:1221 start_codon:yes stop_codon:yes gene_type:complete
MSGFNQIYQDLQIKEIIDTIKDFIKNINEYIPLNNLYLIIIYIFNYEFKEQNNIYLLYFVKFLISIIIIIMPIILLIISLIEFNNIINKNKKYWWAKEKYNYLNTKYIYIKKIYNIFGVKISHNIIKYLSLSTSFIIVAVIIFIKFNELIDNDNKFKYLLYYNLSIFLIIFITITIYFGINYSKYNRVFEYNNEINNIYLKYLNKDYVKKICSNFIDDENNITDTCTFKKIPDTNDLNQYLLTLNINELKESDLDLENENIDINYNTQIANKFISALITHQFLIFIYDNQFKDKIKDNNFCRELKLNSILNNKIDNMFYCFKETTHFPFTANIEGELLESVKFFSLNYKVYTAIIDKYLDINNKLAENITSIKKENINEITIIILISILFIFYLIGLFVIFHIDKD